MATVRMNFTAFNPDGEELELSLPARWEICPHCEGTTKSSAYLGAFTASEMDEEGEDFQRDYMAGFYDRTCDVCGGKGRVLEVDVERVNSPEDLAALELLQAKERDLAECDALERAERARGA